MVMQTEYLLGWDSNAENRKAQFMTHLYKESGRTDGLLTGLWQDFVKLCGGEEEAEAARDKHFGLK